MLIMLRLSIVNQSRKKYRQDTFNSLIIRGNGHIESLNLSSICTPSCPIFPSLTIIMSEDILEKLNKLEAQIFDLPEMQDQKDFDLNSYLNSDIDY